MTVADDRCGVSMENEGKMMGYPVVNGGSEKWRVPGVSIFPTNVPYEMGSQLELFRVPNHLIVGT